MTDANNWAVWPYRAFFYSNEGMEPPHVHVERDGKMAKFWLDPVRLESSGRYREEDLQTIERWVKENQVVFRKAWYEYFGF
jgi:hypothetical protein